MTILVVDHGHSTRCGIRDLGVRIAERLGAVHVDCNSEDAYLNECHTHKPSAVIVNYRADLMPWWRPVPFVEFAVLHQYGPTTVDQRAAELLDRGFDRVLVLDPTVTPTDPRIHAVGRPLPRAFALSGKLRGNWPRIGSFGYAFPHKGFADVASEVATIPDAVYALHMPEAHFNGANGATLFTHDILDDLYDRLDGHELDYTNVDLAPDELVQRLARNDVNCLLYAPGQSEAGLSSALDYLIAAGRPILVSSAEMFVAAQGRAAVWPDVRLADVLADLDYWEGQTAELREITAAQFAVLIHSVLVSL